MNWLLKSVWMKWDKTLDIYIFFWEETLLQLCLAPPLQSSEGEVVWDFSNNINSCERNMYSLFHAVKMWVVKSIDILTNGYTTAVQYVANIFHIVEGVAAAEIFVVTVVWATVKVLVQTVKKILLSTLWYYSQSIFIKTRRGLIKTESLLLELHENTEIVGIKSEVRFRR